MASRVADYTTNLSINMNFLYQKRWQYPSASVVLLNVFNNSHQNMDTTLNEIDKLYKTGKLDVEDLKFFTKFIIEVKREDNKKIFLKLINLFPQDSWAYLVLGKIYLNEHNIEKTYELLTNAKTQGIDDPNINKLIVDCNKNLDKIIESRDNLDKL
jgi:predicted Zn-dependent protease